MSKLEEPARLFDAASSTTDGVRRVLRSGQRGLPGPDELARLAARLPLGPLPPPSGSTPKGAPPKPPVPRLPAAAVPSALPGALVGVVLGLGVVAGMAFRDSASSTVVAVTGASISTTIAAPIAAPRPVDPPVATVPVDPREPARVRPSTSSSIVRADSPPGLVESASPALAASPPSIDVAADTETEAHLLQRAQGALGADPGAALALAGDHARRFPGGSLGQEREMIAVTALVALGRRPEAEARAAALLQRFPGSAYRGRLESLGLGK